jgi:hypothetical protein
MAKGKLCPILSDPKLASFYSKKNLRPADKVGCESQKKIWWECPNCGHEWEQSPLEMSIKSFKNGFCPKKCLIKKRQKGEVKECH